MVSITIENIEQEVQHLQSQLQEAEHRLYIAKQGAGVVTIGQQVNFNDLLNFLKGLEHYLKISQPDDIFEINFNVNENGDNEVHIRRL